MGESFVSPAVLIAGGPVRFPRQVERLLGQLGFTDIANIDGSGDGGGDILARAQRAGLGVPVQMARQRDAAPGWRSTRSTPRSTSTAPIAPRS